MIRFINCFIMIFLISLKCYSQTQFSELKGPYLGQTSPGTTPEIFAPGIISTQNTEWTPTFSQDGYEAFYTIRGIDYYNHLIHLRSINGVWQKPEIASFSNADHNADPFLSPDGKRLFFWSNGPGNPDEEAEDNSDIWYVEREGDSWGKPVRLDTIINTKQWQIFPTVALNGNLYFSSKNEESRGGFDIYMSKFINGGYTKPVNLGDSINTSALEQEPFISPDESYIIFCSDRHAPGTVNWDLYISFKLPNGNWSKAVNMGNKINSPAMDQAPILSGDGKFLFFSSSRTKSYDKPIKELLFEMIRNLLNQPQNGNSDVYWIDAKIINELKRTSNK